MTSAISPRSTAVGVGVDSPGTFSEGGGASLGNVMATEILRSPSRYRKDITPTMFILTMCHPEKWSDEG
jgi:hypothetical protein